MTGGKRAPEREMVRCTTCRRLKLRIVVGKYNSGRSIFESEIGRKWDGRKCPPCTIKEATARTTRARKAYSLENSLQNKYSH